METVNHHVFQIGANTSVSDFGVAVPLNIAIPTMTNGSLPKYLRIIARSGAAANVYAVTPKTSALNGNRTTGFPLSEQANPSVVLNVSGYSHIGYDIINGSGNGTLTFIPLEDF